MKTNVISVKTFKLQLLALQKKKSPALFFNVVDSADLMGKHFK